MEKVYGYIRVSSKGQVEGDGPERQKNAIEDFCAMHGFTHMGNFVEEGVSGTIDAADRPQFVEMLGYIEKNDAGGFVVERMDRLARDLMVSEVLLKSCRDNGIEVFSADQEKPENMAGTTSGDPTRVLIRQIMGALSQWEKSVIVKKLKAARDRKKEKTGRCEGRKAYGDRPGEGVILKLMADMMNDESPMDFGAVAMMLNESGLRTRSGKEWSRQSVRSVWVNYKKTWSK